MSCEQKSPASRGRTGQIFESLPKTATSPAKPQASLTVERHDRFRSGIAMAERAAAFAMTAIRGRTAAEVAAEAAARVIASLRSKVKPEARP